MIEVFCGLPGSGKSYALAWRGLRHLARGGQVWSNFPIAGARVLREEDLVECVFPAGSLVLIDEGQLWFNSREWDKLPKEVLLLFTLHRKWRLDLLVAAQHPMRLDKVIREVAHVFWWAEPGLWWFEYRGYLSMEDFGVGSPWRVSRLLKSRRVFGVFDTYYVHVVSSRERPAPEEEWGARISGAGLSPSGDGGAARSQGPVERERPLTARVSAAVESGAKRALSWFRPPAR